MSVEDFRINAFVRQLLACFWVDLQTLRYGTIGRIVYVYGRFEKVRPPEPGASPLTEMTPTIASEPQSADCGPRTTSIRLARSALRSSNRGSLPAAGSLARIPSTNSSV